MAATYTEIFQDIIHNIQDIVRSEVRLAKIEIREEAAKAKAAALMIAAGALTATLAFSFLMLTVVYALSLILPIWAAALIVAVTLAIVAAGTLSEGLKRFKTIHPTPERTVESLKENAQWVKQQTK